MAENEQLNAQFNLTTGKTDGVKTVDSLNTSLISADKNITQLNSAFAKSTTAITDRLKTIPGAVDKSSASVVNLRDELRGATDEAEKLNDRLGKTPRVASSKPKSGSTESGADAAGRFSTLSGAAGSVLSAIPGAEGLAEASRTVGDIAGLTEQYGKSAAAALPGLAGGVTSLGAMAAFAVPLTLVVGALALVSRGMDEARQAAAAAGKAASDQAALQVQAQQLITAGNAEQVNAGLNQAKADKEVLLARRASIAALRDEAQAQYDKDAARSPLLALDDRASIDDFNSQLKTVDDELVTTERKISEFSKAVTGTGYASAQSTAALEKSAGLQVNALREVSNALASGLGAEQLKQQIDQTNAALATEKTIQEDLIRQGLENSDLYKQSIANTAALTAKFNELNSSTTQTTAAENDLTRSRVETTKAAEQAAKAEADYNKRLAETTARRATQDGDAAIDAANRAADKRADLDRQLASQAEAHADNLKSIEDRGNDAIAAARQALVDKTLATQQAAAEATKNQQDSEAKANSDFAKRELSAALAYQRSRLQIEASFNQSRLDALLSNDIAGLLRAQQSRNDSLTELDTGEQARAAESAAQRDEEILNSRAVLTEKLAALQSELDSFKQQTAEKVKLTEQQTAADLQKAEEAFEEKKALDAELRAIQQAREERDSALRLERQTRDRAAEDEAARLQLEQRLSEINAKGAAEVAVNTSVAASIDTTTAAALRLKSATDLLTQTPYTTPYNSIPPKPTTGTSGTPNPKPFPFAAGGIIPRGVKGLGSFEGLNTEAVIPLESPTGRGLLGGGGSTTIIQIDIANVNAGQIATPNDLIILKDQIYDATSEAFTEFVQAVR